MTWIRTILRELAGLIVDDVRFAIAILAWVLIGWLMLPRTPLPAGAAGVIFFAGLALILAESTLRYARRSRP